MTALKWIISGVRDMFEAADRINHAAIVILDIITMALDIDIAVFTSADLIFQLASIGSLGALGSANATLFSALRDGIALIGGRQPLA